jgi:LysM repeat protein
LASYINTSDERQSDRQSGGSSGGQQAAIPRNSKKISYKVRTGESLYSIAGVFGVTVKDLMAWNYISNPRGLKAEQTLVIYQTEKAPQSPSAQKTTGTASGHTGKHVVKQGETLYGISQMIGVSVNELAQINGLDPKRPLIFPGDVLVYTPKSGGAASESKNP